MVKKIRMDWKINENKDSEVVSNLAKELNVDSVIALMLVNRGVCSYEQAKEFFRPNLSKLHDPFLMKDMDLAVNRILKSIDRQESIMI